MAHPLVEHLVRLLCFPQGWDADSGRLTLHRLKCCWEYASRAGVPGVQKLKRDQIRIARWFYDNTAPPIKVADSEVWLVVPQVRARTGAGECGEYSLLWGGS